MVAKIEEINDDQQQGQDQQNEGGTSNVIFPEQAYIEQIARSVFNPHGDNPEMDQFISGSFSYISEVMHKMTTTTNKEETAKQVAEDLNKRFDTWKANREAANKERQ